MGRYRLPNPNIVMAQAQLMDRVSKLERIPRVSSTGVDSGFITMSAKAALKGLSAYPTMPNANSQRVANPDDFPQVQAYYNAPTDFDDPAKVLHLDVFTSGLGTYTYEATLAVRDLYLQRAWGIYQPAFGIVELFRIVGVSDGTPIFVWKEGSQLTFNYRSMRTGFTHHVSIGSSDVVTGAVSGNAYSIVQFTGSTLPTVKAGWVYAVRIGGAASCAITASMAKWDLYENWVSTASPGTNRGSWSDQNAGAVAGFRTAVPGTLIYLANSGASGDYTFNTNLTVTLTPATANAWTAVGSTNLSPGFYANIERVGRVADPDGWPEAIYVA